MKLAITNENLIRKMCFVVHGSPYGEMKEGFKRSLNKYLKSSKKRLTTRQSIIGWVENNTPPSRGSSFLFLREFLVGQVKRESLQPPQKKVYDQILRFLENALSRKKQNALSPKAFNKQNTSIEFHTSSDNKFVYQVFGTENVNDSIANDLKGLYQVYHVRLGQDNKGEVARECLEIFQKGFEIRFNLWYRDDSGELSKFGGPVFVLGGLLWLFGNNREHENRMRIMAFHHENKRYSLHNLLRWGVLLSDKKVGRAKEPASCRIVLVKSDASGSNAKNQMKDAASAVQVSEFTDEQARILLPLITNDVFDSGVSKEVHENVLSDVLSTNQNGLRDIRELLQVESVFE